MSQNIYQIFTNNPASSMVSTDLLYLGRSPYNTTDDFAITFANFVASIGTSTPTASTITRWDANENFSANNFLANYATTATAAATTTLLVSSAYNQYFTGSTTQSVVMPVTSTLALGFPFRIVNNSTGAVTVKSSGGNTIQVMAAGSTLLLTCILTSGTTAASWDSQYYIESDISGAVLLAPSADQTISANNLFLTSGTFISGSTTGPQGALTGGNIQSVGVNAAGNFIASSYINNSGSSPTYWFYKSRSTTVGSFTALQVNDTIGRLEFFGDDGTQFTQCASMVWQVADSVSSGIVPTVCTFSTMSTGGTLLPAYTVTDTQIVNFNQGVTFQSGTTLSKYIENTFSPTVTPGTVGDWNVTYAMQTGMVTRVGRLVSIYVLVEFTPTFTTASGILYFGALPYVVNSSMDGIGSVGQLSGGFTWPVGATSISISAIGGTSHAVLTLNGSAVPNASIGVSNIVSGVQNYVEFSLNYFV